MILHLGNTFLLLGALTVTAWTIQSESADGRRAANRSGTALVGLALLSILVLGSSGAIAALGDTLFPVASLREGMAQDLSPLAHVFLRLRLLHPFIALVTGLIVFVTASVVRTLRATPRVRLLSRVVTIVFATQFAAGLLNMTLLAPVPMQIVHLLLADATWIALVLMGWEAVYAVAPVEAAPIHSPIMSRNGPAPMSDVPPSTSNVDPVT
jgi:heme A synthase